MDEARHQHVTHRNPLQQRFVRISRCRPPTEIEGSPLACCHTVGIELFKSFPSLLRASGLPYRPLPH